MMLDLRSWLSSSSTINIVPLLGLMAHNSFFPSCSRAGFVSSLGLRLLIKLLGAPGERPKIHTSGFHDDEKAIYTSRALVSITYNYENMDTSKQQVKLAKVIKVLG